MISESSNEGICVKKLLLVEDDPVSVSALTRLLAAEGFLVVSTARQDEVLPLLQKNHFDLALIDLALEQGNGFGACADFHSKEPGVPVIFLTASDDEGSTVAGLDMGAVDYVAKPFRPRELLSRIRVALRQKEPVASVLHVQDLSCEVATAQVRKGEREVTLSAMEYKLLLTFLQSPNKLLTRKYLCDVIWNSAGEYVDDNTLNVYIRRLREKIEDDPSSPELLVTVRGLGYKMVS